jgi:hypothetical protein
VSGTLGLNPRDEALWRQATLTADAATAEVVDALRAVGIRSVLLRGPVLARRLYRADETRYYDDGDILVHPAAVADAEEVLAKLGFVAPKVWLPGERTPHASAWTRDRDGAHLDLHWTLVGVDAPNEEVWEALATDTGAISVAGASVEAPGDAALAVLVAIHAAHHGIKHRKSIGDLERALERFPRAVWADAAALATRLTALPAFAAGLRLLPEGETLAAQLHLPSARSVEIALFASSPPPLAEGFLRLAEARGVRAKAELVARHLVPPRDWMPFWLPAAKRGRFWLAAAYLWRPIWVLLHVAGGLYAYVRARRMARGADDDVL